MILKVTREVRYMIDLHYTAGGKPYTARFDGILLLKNLQTVPSGPKRETWEDDIDYEDYDLIALDQAGVLEWSEWDGSCCRGPKFDDFQKSLNSALQLTDAFV